MTVKLTLLFVFDPKGCVNFEFRLCIMCPRNSFSLDHSFYFVSCCYYASWVVLLIAYLKQYFCVIITCGVFCTFQCFTKKFQLTYQLMKDLRSCLMHASRYKVSLSFGMLSWKPNFFNVWVHFLDHCQQECLSADL